MINTPQAPYYDDFNIEKNFLKILFKPKLSVQTRELEQIQSMFQHQIETLASQIFENGSVISGGKFLFKEQVDYAKLNNEYNTQIFNFNVYNNRYVYGLTTGILGRVFNGWSQGDNETATIYIDYLNSGKNQQQTFQPGEVLQVLSRIYVTKLSGDVNIGDTLQGTKSGSTAIIHNINNNEYEVLYTTSTTFRKDEQLNDTTTSAYLIYNSGESIIYKAQVKAAADDPAPVGFGSAVYVNEGIYYIDGYFVHTGNQSKIISKYQKETNARVGFEKEVKIITSNDDPSLLDNANGYPNENAPGADRLKINLVLNYYNLYETPSENFVEIMKITNSEVTGNSSTNQQYSSILDTLARRTYDESGNYTVNPFLIDIQEFLDDGTNNGIYKETYFGFNTQEEAQKAAVQVFNQPEPGTSHVNGTKYYPFETHAQFLEACKNRLALGVEAGKAYVMGYEIEHNNKAWYPLLKARDTKVLPNSPISISYGNYIKVTNLVGLPNIYSRQLVDLSSDVTFADGNKIGTARIYNIEIESGTIGTPQAVYRLYIDNIDMTGENTFGSSVNTLGTGTDFSAKLVKDNGINVIYGLNQAPLIFALEKSKISSITNSSYDYKKVVSGTVAGTSGKPGSITVAADLNSRFVDPTNNPGAYLLTITSGSKKGEIINPTTITTTVDASGNITFSGLPTETVDQTFTVITTLHKSVNNIKSKTLVSGATFTKESGPFTEVILDHSDGYRLTGIYDSEDPNTPATTNSTNITTSFDFDNGQRDTYYDLARVRLKAGVVPPKGQILVVYDYFSHGGGDYFTVDSYLGQVDYTEIPTYTTGTKTYTLRDCIDIRPRVDDNGSGNFSSPALPMIMANSTIFECDLSYYLPRLDLLELDYKGNFNIKYGTSSDDPQYPVGSINSMTLYYLSVPAYTETPSEVSRLYRENKRYTMRDIGTLDNRISAIEDYIQLTSNELDTNNMPIFDKNGNQCMKTGFIVDMFTDHSYGDRNVSGYRCSIDPTVGNLRPDFKLNVLKLQKSTTQESTITEYNGKYMIPSTTVTYLSNSVNTSYTIMNNNQLVSWMGNINLGTNLANNYNPEDTTKINYGNPTVDGSIYGEIETSWLGTNLIKG